MTTADVLAGLEAGADDYVAKDSAPELVLARVQRLVQYRQLVSHGHAQPAARPGGPSARGHHPRDPRAAVGHPRQRGAAAV